MAESHLEIAGRHKAGAEDRHETAIIETLLSVAKKVRAILALRLAEIGLVNGQDEVLLALDPDLPVSLPALAGKLDMRSEIVSRLVEPLVSQDILKSAGFTASGQRLLNVSPKGVTLQSRIRDIWNEIGADLSGPEVAAPLDRLVEDLQATQGMVNANLTRLC